MKENIVCIIQARMNSSRLPQKSVKRIGSWTMVELVLKRTRQASRINQVLLATSTSPMDDSLAGHVQNLGFPVFRGSENDVLSRFYEAARAYDASIAIRITGDCPLISYTLIDHAIESFIRRGVDYLALSIGADKELAYPRGFDVEVMKFGALAEAAERAAKQYEREHVTPYLYKNQGHFKVDYLYPDSSISRPKYRLCVDTEEDYNLILLIAEHFGEHLMNADHQAIIQFLDDNPEIASINKNVKQKRIEEVDGRFE